MSHNSINMILDMLKYTWSSDLTSLSLPYFLDAFLLRGGMHLDK